MGGGIKFIGVAITALSLLLIVSSDYQVFAIVPYLFGGKVLE